MRTGEKINLRNWYCAIFIALAVQLHCSSPRHTAGRAHLDACFLYLHAELRARMDCDLKAKSVGLHLAKYFRP